MIALRHLARSATLGLALALVTTSAEAQVFGTSFGGAGYSCLNQDNGVGSCTATNITRPVSYIWTAGDFWRQSVSGSGIGSLTGLNLNLNLQNTLEPTAQITFDVFVNGAVVGNTGAIAANGNLDMFAPFSFVFGPISAAIYDIEIRVLAPSVPGGDGSLGLYTDGQSTLLLIGGTTVVPEPTSMAMLLIGGLGLGVVARRRKR